MSEPTPEQKWHLLDEEHFVDGWDETIADERRRPIIVIHGGFKQQWTPEAKARVELVLAAPETARERDRLKAIMNTVIPVVGANDTTLHMSVENVLTHAGNELHHLRNLNHKLVKALETIRDSGAMPHPWVHETVCAALDPKE